jgi:hypothetical protein
MTLDNMRANGVRSRFVYCTNCHHSVDINVDHMADAADVPSIGPRMVCTRCGMVGPTCGRIGVT